jgi:glucoamylase
LATGNRQTPLRALIYLATNQLREGGFPQNFWINGEPYWHGIQLDQVSFPILLAHRLWRDEALAGFDPYVMVMRAAGYLMKQGPATQQERWEEASGYSPSTLAVNIAALVCAANFARAGGDEASAVFLEQHADFIEGHLEAWTVTEEGTLLPDVKRHYVRLNPVRRGDALPDRGVGDAVLRVANRAAGEQAEFPANEIVDAGFLELVRYGIRRADDPLIIDSLRVVDAHLKVETPRGACWRRYNHDGYGQQADGAPFTGAGRGRGWPLLAGERGHYEVAAGGDARAHLRALEQFASPTGLLPEQVWDEPDKPEAHMFLGQPTGAAMPLLWAHAEYVKLLRSIKDGRVFDLIPEVAERYLKSHHQCHKLKVWSFQFPAAVIRRGHTLRVLAEAEFKLHISSDDWQTAAEKASTTTAFDLYYVDLSIAVEQQRPVRFTFFWPEAQRWEGRDYMVEMEAD